METKIILPVLLVLALVIAGCTVPTVSVSNPSAGPTCQPYNSCCCISGSTAQCFNTTECRGSQNLSTFPASITSMVFNQTQTYVNPFPAVNITLPNITAPVCSGTGANTTCTGNITPMNCSLINSSQVCNPA